jgi:acyl-CoA dehydrogenase
MPDSAVAQDEHLFISELLRFVDREVVPLEEANRELLQDSRLGFLPDGRVAGPVLELIRQVRQASARAGFYVATVPIDIGGGGLGAVMTFRLWEALHRKYGGDRTLVYWVLAHFATGPNALLRGLRRPIAEHVLGELMSGDKSLCFALSEPDAGSDVWAMQTKAVADGDDWVLNGTKQWITNGAHADYALTFAVTSPERVAKRSGGISCFLIPTDHPGFGIDSIIRLFGHVGGHEAILNFNGVRISSEWLIGEIDAGFQTAMQVVGDGRLYNCARCIGLGRWALEIATDYAKSRRAFGSAIAEHQGVQWLLAESAMELYAARAMSLDCASRLDRGQPAIKELAMSKAFVTEASFRALDRCMQVFGGMGLTNETRLHDAWHTIRTVRIAEGSAEIMRRTIARQLLKGDFDF